MLYRCLNQGRSMIEMIGVLSIIAMLTVGGVYGYAKAMETFRVQNTIERITELSLNIRNAFINEYDYSAMDKETPIIQMMNIGAVPEEWPLEDCADYGEKCIRTPFQTLLFLYPTDDEQDGRKASFGYNLILDIKQGSVEKLPKKACISLATTLWFYNGAKAVGFTSSADDFDISAKIIEASGKDCVESEDSFFCTYKKNKYQPITPIIASKYCQKNDAKLVILFE